MHHISIQSEAFDVGLELDRLSTNAMDKIGAISSFTGIVRSENNITALSIEHHPVMTLKAMEQMIEHCMERYILNGVILIHRYGRLNIGEPIVLVAASSAHRKDAMRAVQFLIDRLKTDIPLWKKEIFADGTSHWIEQKQSDIAKAAEWK